MALRIVPFAPDLLPAIIPFSETLWTRPRTDAYYRWRYLECPSQLGFLAMRDERCLAMVWAISRPYQAGSQTMTGLEVLDWFCLPELRKSGLGIRLMHELMKRAEPLVVLGGSCDTQTFLPQMGWKTLGKVPSFILPLEGTALGHYARSRFGIPSSWVRTVFRATARPWFYPRSSAKMSGRTVTRVKALNPAVHDLYRSSPPNGMTPLPDAAFIQWLMIGTPYVGEYLLHEFTVGQKLKGWSLSRIYSSAAGKEARIIDLYTPEESLASWIVEETMAALLAFGPDTLRATSGHPAIQQALRQFHFLRAHDLPVFIWPKTLNMGDSVDAFGHNTSDAPFLPYNE